MTVHSSLTSANAQTLIEAARAAASAAGVPISVTVVDAGGHLLAFQRDERAVLISGETSRRKAYTALQLGAATADLVNAVQPGNPLYTLPTALDRPLLFIPGGVPLHSDGRLIGAIGVGGGTPEQDHAFAAAAQGKLDTMARTPQEVFADHGIRLGSGDLDLISQNYAEDAVLITPTGTLYGRAGVHKAVGQLLVDLPDADWQLAPQFAGDILFLQWTAATATHQVTTA